MSRWLFVCSLTLATAALSLPDEARAVKRVPSPGGAWAYSRLPHRGHAPQWYPRRLAEFDQATFVGWVDYCLADRQTLTCAADHVDNALGFHVFETCVHTERDLELDYHIGGDDGAGLFLDGVFQYGRGFQGREKGPKLKLKANTPHRLTIGHYNSMGPWAARMRVFIDGQPRALTEVPGLTIDASCAGPRVAPPTTSTGHKPGPAHTRASLHGDRIDIAEKVHFDTAKASIQPRSYPLLRDIARLLKAHRAQIRSVRIEGHTDDRGGASYNKRLSDRRAGAVREFLIGQGVSPRALTVQGWGQKRPLRPNDTREGRAANRRVELHVRRR